MPRTDPSRLHELDDQLQLALLFVDRHVTVHEQLITDLDGRAAVGAPEHHTAHLRFGIFKREVDVAGGRPAHGRHLALYP